MEFAFENIRITIYSVSYNENLVRYYVNNSLSRQYRTLKGRSYYDYIMEFKQIYPMLSMPDNILEQTISSNNIFVMCSYTALSDSYGFIYTIDRFANVSTPQYFQLTTRGDLAHLWVMGGSGVTTPYHYRTYHNTSEPTFWDYRTNSHLQKGIFIKSINSEFGTMYIYSKCVITHDRYNDYYIFNNYVYDPRSLTTCCLLALCEPTKYILI